jgi:hypothetical protein
MTLYRVTIPTGDRRPKEVVEVIVNHLAMSQSGMNDLRGGIVSEEMTQIYIVNSKVEARTVVVFEGWGSGGHEASPLRPRLHDLVRYLRRMGFACDQSSIWLEEFQTGSERKIADRLSHARI